ncbi:MAG TPA: hypothetical protein PKA27_15570 [Fimbriimonadaceae bacterium]|nr:hypothetical protein [Fimbriimonadaceae bacterium]
MLTTLVLAMAAMSPVSEPAKSHMVTVTVHRVAQIDNLDKMDVDPDRADFYAQIWIDGQPYESKNFSFDDGRPYWTFTAEASSNSVPIRIKLLDDDGGLEEQDDFVDINRRKGKKDLDFHFNRKSGRITGDVRGRENRMVHSWGDGDNDKGQIWFTVSASH